MCHISGVDNLINCGETIKKLRKENKYSQDKLAKLANCSRRTIIRIEKNDVPIDDFMEDKFNIIFNIDLKEYNKITSLYNDYSTYQNCILLKNAILSANYDSIISYNEKFKKLVSFQKGEPLLLLTYSDILILITLHNKLDEALKLALMVLKITGIDELFLLLKTNILSDSTYSIIIAITSILDSLGDTKTSYTLTQSLYEHFNTFIFNEKYLLSNQRYDFVRKYITIVNNYADSCFEMNELSKANKLLDIGIDTAIKYESTHSIEYLYALKTEINYLLGDITQSKENFDIFYSLCKFKNNTRFLEKKMNDLHNKYYKLFD